MTHIFVALLTLILILKYVFANLMERKYKIINSEFQKIKSKTIKKPIYFFIILAILLYLVIKFRYNIYFVIIVLVVLIWEFIHGLTEIKKLNEYRYTLYYIVDEIISFLILLLGITLIIFS
ncbi:MAG: hypothetical protein KIB00_17265 [Paeniclostridium sordellii]|nr:hypothetical protein [Paeniclostridium sordellii]